jgi:hypothetical protein
MDCAKARAYMCPELDDELPVTGSALLQEHLETCSKCNYEWEKLMLVHQGLRALKTQTTASDGFEERLLLAIDKESCSSRLRSSIPLLSLSMIAVAACLLVFLIPPLFHSPEQLVAKDSAEILVVDTADGEDNLSEENFHRLVSSETESEASAAKLAGIREKRFPLANLKAAAIDVFEDKNHRRILRTCYQDRRDHSFCIDCYQAKTGLLAFEGEEIFTGDGQKVIFKHVGNHNVVLLTRGGVDYLFASSLSKQKLLSKVLENS